ncbi:MAG: SDR family NAD(P)-dependent oxidoreductase, partial [Actinomycetota bacterium]
TLRTVVLAQRSPDAVADLDDVGPDVEVVSIPFDATDHAGHRAWIAALAERIGDLDVVVQAAGQLGLDAADDPAEAARLVDVNTAGAVSSGLAVAERLHEQGHGVLVVLSSVAGIRTRASNFVYGATKSGQDAFATGLDARLAGSGARVLTARPGFVRSQMTAGMEEAPFACDPGDVGEAVAEAIRRGRRVVWVPGVLRYVFGLLRFAPEFVWRRLDR